MRSFSKLTALVATMFAMAVAAFAQPMMGAPVDAQIGLQPAVSEMGVRISEMFNGPLMITMSIIAVFVTVLLVWVLVRYNAGANKEAAKFSHNTLIEVIWIAIPTVIVLVLLVMAWFLIFFIDKQPTRPGVVIEVVGKPYKWTYNYLSYMPADEYEAAQAMLAENEAKPVEEQADVSTFGEYINFEGFTFDSCSAIGCGNDAIANDLGDGLQLAAVDHRLVIPSGTDVQFLVTGETMGHAFAMPAMGIKIDAWPGRTNETWTNVFAGKEGLYIGQCSELCGWGHAYMPIVIEVVTPEQFDAWIATASETVISSGGVSPPPRVEDVLGANYWTTQTAMVAQ